jgi:hypothetical protein
MRGFGVGSGKTTTTTVGSSLFLEQKEGHNIPSGSCSTILPAFFKHLFSGSSNYR